MFRDQIIQKMDMITSTKPSMECEATFMELVVVLALYLNMNTK